jgi:hypothetical protein
VASAIGVVPVLPGYQPFRGSPGGRRQIGARRSARRSPGHYRMRSSAALAEFGQRSRGASIQRIYRIKRNILLSRFHRSNTLPPPRKLGRVCWRTMPVAADVAATRGH